MQTNLVKILRRLERWGTERAWVGPDPYEGLNSALGRRARSRRARQLVIQAYKRLPIDPPWPLRAPRMPNAKALALALAGYSTPAGRELPGADEFLSRLPAQIEALNLRPDGAAWGYHFDVQTRHLFYDRRTPNAVATTFVVGALCDAAEASGDDRHLQLALAARPFLLSLLKEASGHGPFFAYVDAGSELIHNANLLVCGALARLHLVEADQSAVPMVEDAVATTLRRQRADGLWSYGEAPNLGWADNFHTAYVLEGLARVHEAFGVGGDALRRGLSAWRERFFEADGWARYYPDRRYPLEPHSCASALDLLLVARELDPGETDAEMGERIASSAIRELWLEDPGRFAFRRTARGLNRREFMRWTNAPMFKALAGLVSYAPRAGDGDASALGSERAGGSVNERSRR